MVEDGGSYGFEVFEGGHVISAEGGAGFRAEDEILHGARAGSPTDSVFDPLWGFGLAGAGLAHDGDGIVVKVVGNRDTADEVLEGDDFLAVDELCERLFRGAGGFAGDAFFLLGGWILHFDQEHETVELGLGKRVGPFLLDGVLGGEHEERRLQGVGLAEHGDLVFLHRFQHRGLGFRGSAVDLVGKQQVGEYGALDELELALSAGGFLDDVGAGDVGGHQVRGELDAVEGKVEGLRDGGNEQCLREAGDAHQQGMAAGEEADSELLDHIFLADNRFAELAAESLVDFPELIDGSDIIGGKLVR